MSANNKTFSLKGHNKMAKNQTFSVSLNLLTKNFNKGVKTIQTSLNRLRMQFRSFAAAMGAGLGLSELARNMVDTARKMDKAQAVLKNVSTGLEGYASNQQYVMNLSKKYNQDLITLTGNFAKYHAVANQANMPLEQQEHIFEALTRASAFFNLSADETNGVMLAITQMMSKGKVSSEELRQQLAERLPGAMGIMAKAIGVTTEELGEMMKKGQVLATDALPKFADELNNVTKNLNLDNIESATANLRNAFTNLTGKLNVGGIYKNMVNGITSGLNYIANNLKEVGEKIAIVLGTLASKPLIQKAKTSWDSFFNGLEIEAAQTTKKIQQIQERAHILANSQGIKIDSNTLQPMVKPVKPAALKSYERLKILADDYAEQQRILAIQQDQLNNKFNTMAKKVGNAAKEMLKMIGIQAAYYAVAAAISYIITKLVSWYKEQQRIKNLVSDTRKEFEKMSNTLGGEEIELQELSKALAIESEREKAIKKALGIESERGKAIKKINQLLGLQGKAMFTLASSDDDINAKIQERIKLLKQEREYQSAKQIVADATNRKQELEDRNKSIAALQGIDVGKVMGKAAGGGSPVVGKLVELFTDKKLANEYKRNAQEIEQLNNVLDEYSAIVQKLSLSSVDRDAILNPPTVSTDPGDGGDNKVMEDYKEIQDDYNKDLRTLNEMKKNQLMTDEEYKKALEELTLKTAESILALNDIDENTDQFAKSILDAAKAYIANAEKENKAKEALDEYNKSVKALQNQYKAGVITEKELNDGMYELLQEVVTTISAFGELSGTAKELADKFKEQKKQKVFDSISKEEAPKMGDYNTTFNYKKESSEMLQENSDYLKEYAEDLKAYIDNLKEYKDQLSGDELVKLNGYITELEGNLESVSQKATSFAQAAQFAEVQEDIKNMKKELAEGIWDNISGIATAAERLTNSWKSLSETMNDTDATGWEKFLTVFTTIISTIETLVSVYQTLQTAVAAYKALQLGMAAAEQAGIAVEFEKLAVMTAQNVIAKQLAVAKGMQSAAAVPYPANLAAIASTSAALAAAFAAVPAFAQGGIVDSNSTIGDKNLIRVNGGEAVLTRGQQATLWNLLDGQTSMMKNSGAVEFKIRGQELVGVLNNYQKKISK